MRYVRIFLLILQEVFEQRTRSLVWFVISLINPLLMLLFWRGANLSTSSFSFISSYYFILMIGGSLLMSHSEESIALIDIQEGKLATYLLKPLTYFGFKWLAELPCRVLQGSFGVATVILLSFLFHLKLLLISPYFINILLVICIILAAISLAQVYKMCLGFVSFWTTDVYGIFQFSEMLSLIFAGVILPLSFYPHVVSIIAYILPFAYIIYFPVAAVVGLFTTNQLFFILCGQIIWIGILFFIYKMMWRRGVKIFTGVGQ